MENISFGVCKSIFALNLKIWKGQKPCRNIKIHRELVSCNFHFPENRKTFKFVILGLMEITGNSWKPSVWCRGCPQVFYPKSTYLPGRSLGFFRPSKNLNKLSKKSKPFFNLHFFKISCVGYWIVLIGPTNILTPFARSNQHLDSQVACPLCPYFFRVAQPARRHPTELHPKNAKVKRKRRASLSNVQT